MTETDENSIPSRSIVQYKAPWTIYGMDWCDYDDFFKRQRILISSYKQTFSNCIQVRFDYVATVILIVVDFELQSRNKIDRIVE